MLTHLPISSVSLPVNIPRNCLFFTLSIRKLINVHGFTGQHYVEDPQIFLCGPDVLFKCQLFIKLFLPAPSMVSDTKLALKNERINDFANIGFCAWKSHHHLHLKCGKTKLIFSSHHPYPHHLLILPMSVFLPFLLFHLTKL